MEKGEEANWSETVEDLVAAGDVQAAINLLDSIVSKQENLDAATETTTSALQLSAALGDLAALYSSLGFSLNSDELRSRAALIKQRAHSSSYAGQQKDAEVDSLSSSNTVLTAKDSVSDNPPSDDSAEKSTELDTYQPAKSSSDDDWEAIADREPNELLSLDCLSGVSRLSLEYNKVLAPKRRGRGTFSYQKKELYSDRVSDRPVAKDEDDEEKCPDSDRDKKSIQSNYGTRHVLVLADFSPSTRTIDLEKLFQDFTDRGFAIRWVNDTTALAVFRTPSTAIEARDHVCCSFKVHVLDEDDMILDLISAKDLEPPRERPKTSARTAQRLIAQGMGLKLPSSTSAFGSKELRKQEEARRNRIVTRQNLKDDAWGPD